MFRFTTDRIFGVFLVLVGLIFISSASCANDARGDGQELAFSENDLRKDGYAGRMDRAARFIGDLTIGKRLPNESVYSRSFNIYNSADTVNTTTYYYTVPRGKIHYLSVLNDVGSYSAICDYPYSLGTGTTYFSVRTLPRGSASLSLVVAAR